MEILQWLRKTGNDGADMQLGSALLKLYCAPIGKAFNMLKLADYLEEEEEEM